MAFPSFNRNRTLDFSHLEPPRLRGAKPDIGKITRLVAGLPPSDKVIAGGLGVLVVIGCFASLAVLLRSFQVTVPAHGGTLTEGVVGSPRFVNPLLALSDSDRDLVALTYAGLMGHNANGALVPVVAESYTASTDGTMYTFVIRSGAKFSDGTPVTADDVVYTVEKAQDPALKSPVHASWANIRAQALDARTVRFTLPKAYAPFLEDTTLGILPKHIWQNIRDEEFPFSTYDTMPIGAGPFTAESVSRDSEGTITGYRLDANKYYPIGRPYLSHIRLNVYASQSDLQKALASRKIQSAYGVATNDVKSVPYARVFGVFFNANEEPAFKDLGVRKALSLAIDRTTLTKEVLGGYATPLAGPLPAGSAVRALPLPDDATRVEDAKAALTAAGYSFDQDTGTWSKKGQKLQVTLATSNVPELKAVAAQVQRDWQALGVPTELELHDPSDLTQSVIRPRAYGALLFGEVIGTDPDLYAFWASSERDDQGLNIANYSNTDVDTLLEKARTESDPAQVQDTLAQIQEKIAADYPAAFLYTPEFLYTVPSTIHGVGLSSVSAPSDRFWGIVSWYRYTEHVWPAFVPAHAAGD